MLCNKVKTILRNDGILLQTSYILIETFFSLVFLQEPATICTISMYFPKTCSCATLLFYGGGGQLQENKKHGDKDLSIFYVQR